MIKLEGKINRINPTNTYKDFDKRTFWFELNDNGYVDVIQLELWKKDCEMIDSYKVGDQVTVFIDIKGKIWNKEGKELVTNTIKCWNIEKEGVSYKKI
jgi:hypothetical protein